MTYRHPLGLIVTAILLLVAGCARQAGNASPAVAAVPAPPATPEAEVAAAPPTTAPAAFPVVDPADWPAADPETLAVDANIRSGPISPLLFGSNTGPWSAVPFDLLDEAKAARITLLRFPGGEFADRNVVLPSHIDSFIKLCRQLGAEPSIHVRLREGTPEAAAEMVRYANIEKGYGVRYWAVGNEPNLYPPDDVYTPKRIAADWRALAEAMRAVDPDIILMGPEVTGYMPARPGDTFGAEARAVMKAFLEVNGDLVDVVTIHHYPFPISSAAPPPAIDELAASALLWDPMLVDLKSMIRETTGRDIPIGMTEFNANWSKQSGGEATPDSIPGALWLADVLGRLIRNQATIGTQFALQSGPVIGPFGLLDRAAVRPQYYVYPLYARFGPELVYAAVGGPAGPHPTVTAYAARNDAGALTLLVINRGQTAAEFTLSLAGHAGGAAQIYRLDAERVGAGSAAAPAGTAELADGMTLAAPPLTATLYVLP